MPSVFTVYTPSFLIKLTSSGLVDSWYITKLRQRKVLLEQPVMKTAIVDLLD
jgi:hypothetical protein